MAFGGFRERRNIAMKVSEYVGALVLIIILTVGLSYGQHSGRACYEKGLEYATQGKLKEAKEEFEKILKHDPAFRAAESCIITIKDVTDGKIKSDTAIHMFKGTFYQIKGKPDLAIKDYNTAIEINPNYAAAYINRGIYYGNNGQPDLAIKDYSKAIELNPRYTVAFINRGGAYGQKGEYNLALQDFDKAIEIDPNYADAYTNRGFVYHVKLKDKEKGCSDWKRACDLGECANYNMAKKNGDCK